MALVIVFGILAVSFGIARYATEILYENAIKVGVHRRVLVDRIMEYSVFTRVWLESTINRKSTDGPTRATRVLIAQVAGNTREDAVKKVVMHGRSWLYDERLHPSLLAYVFNSKHVIPIPR